ncbi:MAG: hypothetical protein KF685_10770 [Acidobacteria bacterium]|nr:hypothetical protein [Acidobacteriota bacterium]
MSSLVWMILLVLLLTVLGSAVLLFITTRFYWGDRGKPLPDREIRKQKREEELRMREKQIEHAKNNPVTSRSESFWDNTKK